MPTFNCIASKAMATVCGFGPNGAKVMPPLHSECQFFNALYAVETSHAATTFTFAKFTC